MGRHSEQYRSSPQRSSCVGSGPRKRPEKAHLLPPARYRRRRSRKGHSCPRLSAIATPPSWLLLLAKQYRGEPFAVGWRQIEQRRSERVESAGLLGFRLAGATAGATGFGAWRIRLMGHRVALLFRLNGVQEVAG